MSINVIFEAAGIFCHRVANIDMQQNMAAVMRSHANTSAENLGVSAKLAAPSYSSVIDVLKTTPDMVSPLMKLNNLCKFISRHGVSTNEA